MSVTENASLFTFFNEVCNTGEPFAIRVKETRGNETKTLGKDDAQITPYVGYSMKP